MDTIARERTWVGRPLVSGYVRSKTRELVLSTVFAVSYHIVRQFAVMIYPMVFIRFSGIFAYIPATFLPWRYTLVVPILVFFTTPYEPFASAIGIFAGIQVAYFGSRLFKKHRILPLVASTFTTNFLIIFIRANIIGLYPFDAAIGPGMLKAALLAAGLLILGPPILKILERKRIVSFKEE